jgi:hypothetical protein
MQRVDHSVKLCSSRNSDRNPGRRGGVTGRAVHRKTKRVPDRSCTHRFEDAPASPRHCSLALQILVSPNVVVQKQHTDHISLVPPLSKRSWDRFAGKLGIGRINGVAAPPTDAGSYHLL